MIKGITICLISILIAGCVNQGIKPEERDRSGNFDGVWDVIIGIEKQRITGGGEYFICEKGEFYITMYIADGQMSSLQTKKGDGYIKEDGTFYVNEQHGEFRSTDFIANLEKHYIFSGHLNNNKGEGSVVITRGLRNYGCKGTVMLKRRGY